MYQHIHQNNIHATHKNIINMCGRVDQAHSLMTDILIGGQNKLI